MEDRIVELEAQLARVRASVSAWKQAARKWRRKAKREKARREYDSVDAYNARINAALLEMRDRESRIQG